MKRDEEKVVTTEEGFELRLRPTTTVSLQIPVDALRSWETVANSRDMSLQALMKLYIG